jgi:outer membrane protein assembly factor BamB
MQRRNANFIANPQRKWAMKRLTAGIAAFLAVAATVMGSSAMASAPCTSTDEIFKNGFEIPSPCDQNPDDIFKNGFEIPSPNDCYDWLQFNGDPQHSGNNTQESTLNKSNVNQLTLKYQAALPAPAYGTPVFLHSIKTTNGVKDLLFLSTTAGDVLALDAATGIQIWIQSYPNPYTLGQCLSGDPPCSTASSPAIDPDRQYVYANGLDGFVHKLQVANGVEVTGGGWPQLSTLKAYVERASSALATATSSCVNYLYASNSGFYGEAGVFEGHVTTINLDTGAQNVFNMMCSNQTTHLANPPSTPNCGTHAGLEVGGGGVWARPGVIYDEAMDRIFAATGNGDYNPVVHDWSDSVVSLNPSGTGSGADPIDTYTPANQSTLANDDLDLGSAAPAILPVPASSNVQHLALQAGKDGVLRLLNLSNLSGAGGVGHLGGEVGATMTVPQGGSLLSQPAVWINPADQSTWVFLFNNNGSSALRLSVDGSGSPSLTMQWKNANGGTSPLLANNVLYYAGFDGALHAVDPTTASALWSSTQQTGSPKFQTPIVAGGVVYLINGTFASGTNQLSAFGLP